jgi:hypothetical protein
MNESSAETPGFFSFVLLPCQQEIGSRETRSAGVDLRGQIKLAQPYSSKGSTPREFGSRRGID